MDNSSIQTAVLGGGCFWCTEAVFESLKGVKEVLSGYSGGDSVEPTYEDVCTGATGHAEVVRVTFDPAVISYREILQVFFATHDPTTKDRQGNDVGTQYRSAVFYDSAQQREEAEKVIAEITKAGIFDAPIVTEVTELKNFYPAESYHHNYFANYPEQPYCLSVIAPKVAKFRKQFLDRLKK